MKPVVEVVCGSRFSGIFPAIDQECAGDEEEVVVAAVMGRKTALSNLMRNCKIICDQIAGLPLSVRIALELEPGPIFTMNDENSIGHVLRHLRQGDQLKRVGFNLDIAHWRMAGFGKPQLALAGMSDRIWHAHLSGHHPHAHFGDLAPLSINVIADYREWIDFLAELPQGDEKYSGVVALEIEAIANFNMLCQALADARQLF
jgi:sugar phosphate isomerase/epimerase